MHKLLQFFWSVQKEEGRLRRKIRRTYSKVNFEDAYLRDSWADSTEIWNEMCAPRGTFHSKNGAVLFRRYRVTDAWKRHFLGFCIIHTCLLSAHTGCTWPHDTLSCVLIHHSLDFLVSLQSLFRELSNIKSHPVDTPARWIIIQ